MIKAVALDIDGVIVGTKKGINLPNPSLRVSQALRKVHDNGIPVVFISAKTSFAVSENIKHVGLDNPHIADSGAVLFNPIKKELVHAISISPIEINQILSSLPSDTLVNLFTTENYYVLQEMQEKFPDFVKRYGDLMHRMPSLVNNFGKIIKKEKVVKINIYAFDIKQKKQLTEMISKSKGKFTYRWTGNPHLTPVEVMIITALDVSKRSGVERLVHDLKIDLSEILGIGDQLQDWDFMEVCGYKATLANGSKELKSKLDFSDEKQFMGRHVDEDGIIDILEHFKLL